MDLDLTSYLSADQMDSVYKIMDDNHLNIKVEPAEEEELDEMEKYLRRVESQDFNVRRFTSELVQQFQYTKVDEFDEENPDQNDPLRREIVDHILSVRPTHGSNCFCPMEFKDHLHRMYEARGAYDPTKNIAYANQVKEEDLILKAHQSRSSSLT